MSTAAPSNDKAPQVKRGNRAATRAEGSGYPVLCTDELTTEFVKHITEGVTTEGAVKLVGISYSTYDDWMRWGDEPAPREPFRTFRQAVLLAEGRVEKKAVEAWFAGMPKDWRAAKEWLQARFPSRYRDMKTLVVQQGGPTVRTGEDGLSQEEHMVRVLVILAEAGALPEELADHFRSIEPPVIDAEIIGEGE